VLPILRWPSTWWLVLIPIDHSPTGLPIGVQIVGPYLEDRTPIAFAELLEREFGGFVPPPGYAG
jgi:amidase